MAQNIINTMSPARKFIVTVALLVGVLLNIVVWQVEVDQLKQIAQLPFKFLIILTIGGSALSAAIIVEIVRSFIASSRIWNEAKHFKIVTFVWITIFIIQVTGMWYFHKAFTP